MWFVSFRSFIVCPVAHFSFLSRRRGSAGAGSFLCVSLAAGWLAAFVCWLVFPLALFLALLGCCWLGSVYPFFPFPFLALSAVLAARHQGEEHTKSACPPPLCAAPARLSRFSLLLLLAYLLLIMLAVVRGLSLHGTIPPTRQISFSPLRSLSSR